MPIESNLKGLERLSQNASDGLSKGLKTGGDYVVDLASQLAPKDTEELSKSGKVEVKSPTLVEVSFGNDLPDDRAPAQEFGTIDTPAQPYLTPAAANINVMSEITKAIFDALKI